MPTPRDLRNISEALVQAGATLHRTSKLIEASENTSKKLEKGHFVSATWENGKLTIRLVEPDTSGYRPEYPTDLHPEIRRTKLPKEVAAFLRSEAANLVNEATVEIQSKASQIHNSSKGFLTAAEATKLAAEKVRQAATLEEMAAMCDVEKATVRIEGASNRGRAVTSVCILAKHVGHIIVNGREHYDWGIQGACVEIQESYRRERQEPPCCPRERDKCDPLVIAINTLQYAGHGYAVKGKVHPFVAKLSALVSEALQEEVLALQGATGPITYKLASK